MNYSFELCALSFEFIFMLKREFSAGGVVFRREGKKIFIALLKTRYKEGEAWVLPKGHIEEKDRELTAKREVAEEIGIKKVKIIQEIARTHYFFKDKKGNLISKTVYFYLMETKEKKLKPQKKEGFLEARWFPLERAVEIIAFEDTKKMLKKVKKILSQD